MARMWKITLYNEIGAMLETRYILAVEGQQALLQYLKEQNPILEKGDKITIE